MSRENLRKIAPQIKRLIRVDTIFMSYTKEIPIIGKTVVTVKYKDKYIKGDLYIADSELNTLCGRE